MHRKNLTSQPSSLDLSTKLATVIFGNEKLKRIRE
jgi:hypothetical protein